MPQAVLIAPFWNQPEHVGLRRLQAMRRWFRAAGVRVVVVSAGPVADRRDLEGDVEVVVPDPHGTSGDPRAHADRRLPLAGLWRLLEELRHLPDAGVDWARAAAGDPRVLEAATGSAVVVSTSPPESGHVAGAALATQLGAAHVVDMQDGWLDEPLKPALQKLAFRRWQEGRLEERILADAASILVTSEVWAERLAARRPSTTDRITVLHSAAPPPEMRVAGAPPDPAADGLLLLHAGTFTLSHNARRVDLLLEPLRHGLRGARGRVVLLGRLQPFEEDACRAAVPGFAEHGWSLETRPPVPREEFLSLMPRAHGLLLLSASGGALPSKLFEYLTTGRPILAVTAEGSAVWRLGGRLPALFRVDPRQPATHAEAVGAFLAAASDPSWHAEAPPEFEEDALGQVFLDAVGPLWRDRT